MLVRKALLFALFAHGEQKRKDGRPYIYHPVEVAMDLARSGADDTLIAAGYLHDTIEDAFITREQLEAAFNKEIADLVDRDSEDKTKSWEERKQTMLDELRKPGDRSRKMLMCADKLSNLRSIKEGLDESGEESWKRYKRGRDKQAWLYRETVDALSSLEGLPMYEELKSLTEEIFDDKKEQS